MAQDSFFTRTGYVTVKSKSAAQIQFLIYWSQLIFKEASGKRRVSVRGVTEPLLYLGHHETGQVICSSENHELERDILLRIYKTGMKKLNEKNHKYGK